MVKLKTAAAKKASYDRSYHVDWNAAHDRWDVVDDAGRVHGHCQDLAAATALAIREAHQSHGAGSDVVVCVQQKDGTYKLAWSSH